MKRPIEETRRLLKTSNTYLAQPTGENERTFLQALADLERAEEAAELVVAPASSEPRKPSLFQLVSLRLVRSNILSVGAAAIVVILIGVLLLSAASGTLFSQSPTPTLQVSVLTTPVPNLCPVGMIIIPQSNFLMGAAPEDKLAQADEKPQRSVALDAYCIDRSEVSNAQYAEFLNATNHTAPRDWTGSQYPKNINQNFGDLPVVNVSWLDARDYCTWSHKQLPTEAQWEKAARGSDGRLYPWGNTFDVAKANSGETTPRELRPVDSYTSGQSPYGVLNMAGNAAEWVADLYLADAYTRMPDLNPQGPDASTLGNRVIRGGSFNDSAANLRVTARVGIFAPTIALPNIGFRCAK